MTVNAGLKDLLAYEETFDCVQCGYCLPSCPTYMTMEKESHSPRGRVHLVKMAAEGKISIEEMERSLDLCLGCRACETACPTNVQYGKIFESAKVAITENSRDSMTIKEKAIRNMVFKRGISNKKAMNVIGSGMQWYQKAKIDQVFRKSGLSKLLPKSMREMELIIPKVEKSKEMGRKYTLLKPDGSPVMRVAFFTGCIMDAFFGRINDLSMLLLQKAGCEVILIEEQGCCGALHQHSGETDQTRELAKANIDAFEKYNADFVVNSIGGCGAMMVEYHHLFQQNDEWYPRAKKFAEKAKDVSWILDQLNLPFIKNIPRSAVYQPSCHLRNVQKVQNQPVNLLKKIPGLSYLKMPEEDMCCGSAGIYNIIHYEEASNILERKMGNITPLHPDLVVTSNPGCHLQLLLGVKKEGLEEKVKVIHIIELLAEACGLTQSK
ncbi:(Fe-S)-binding protein [Bacillus sp. ISL-47]|uniref:(Fe-S)-binding protein n=1 Tax=Bacillus sp. ISL-47 TaxID=2819130 RepID=UPI001BE70DCC|nr:(Fe-S)-binding protein [Bacillus sp. ISL-47]MBT2688066.1 (Fe-S)-binding protein [Bacillus sp. ISL-47]MBT2707924.1 (Fe-S)-binding protein [Pseudomonas sp. ISL-84]